MRLFRGSVFSSQKETGKKMNKKRCMSIISMTLAVIMFILSGISSFADDLNEDVGGTGFKYVKLNQPTLCYPGASLTYEQNPGLKIPYVVVIKQIKNWLTNKSEATIWTTSTLSDSQKKSLITNICTTARGTEIKDKYTKDIKDNIVYSLCDVDKVEVKAISSESFSQMVGAGVITKTKDSIKVSGSDDIIWIYGTFNKVEEFSKPTVGFTINLTPREESDVNSFDPVKPNDNNNSKEKYVKLNQQPKLKNKGTTIKYTSSDTEIPYVVVIKQDGGWVTNNSKAAIWTPVTLTKEQKMSLSTNLCTCANITTLNDSFTKKMRTNMTTAMCTIDRIEFKPILHETFEEAVGAGVVTKTSDSIRVLSSEDVFWLYGSFTKSNEFCKPTSGIDYSDVGTESNDENNSNNNNSNNNNTIKDGYINFSAVKLFKGKTTLKLDKADEKPFLMSVDNDTVCVWTRDKLSETQQGNFTKILNETCYTIPISGQYDVINKAVNNKKLNYSYTVTKGTDQILGTTKKLTFTDSGTEVLTKEASTTVDWFIAGYYTFADTAQKSVKIEDARNSANNNETNNNNNNNETNNNGTNNNNNNKTNNNGTNNNNNNLTNNNGTNNSNNNETNNNNNTNTETVITQNNNSTGSSNTETIVISDSSNNGGQNNSQNTIQEATVEGQDNSTSNLNNESTSNTTGSNTTAVSSDDSPKTSDASSMILFISLGVISLLVSLYFYYLSRKCED